MSQPCTGTATDADNREKPRRRLLLTQKSLAKLLSAAESNTPKQRRPSSCTGYSALLESTWLHQGATLRMGFHVISLWCHAGAWGLPHQTANWACLAPFPRFRGRRCLAFPLRGRRGRRRSHWSILRINFLCKGSWEGGRCIKTLAQRRSCVILFSRCTTLPCKYCI